MLGARVYTLYDGARGMWAQPQRQPPQARFDAWILCQGCHNKVPQMGRGLNPEIYFLTVLEAKRPRLRCQQGCFLLRLLLLALRWTSPSLYRIFLH